MTNNSARKSDTRPLPRSFLMAAAALSASAAIVHTKSADAERKNPPLGNFIDVDGVRLHYVERGSGPALVFVHGNFFTLHDFTLSALFELASEKYRVIAFDRPGFGYSARPRDRVWSAADQAELLYSALVRLGLRQAYLVGHSWGALVALEAALRYPSSLGGVGLISGYYYPTASLDAVLLSIPAVPVLGTALRHSVLPLYFRATWPLTLRWLFSPAEISPAYARFPTWLSLRPCQLRALGEDSALLVPSAAALQGRLQSLAVPAMIIAGESDMYIDTGTHSARLHREIPGSQLRVVKGAGHMVHHTAPRLVLSAIDELVESGGQARRSA